jgi:hypothetical protein
MRVYPVAGRYLNGVPHVEHDCDDPFCVESGAFTEDPPDEPAEQTEDPADAGSLDSEES